MPTARQIAAEQKRRRKERERDERKADRAKLKDLRARIKNARKHARHRRREVSALCKRGRLTAREAAKQIRARHRAQIKAEIDAARAQSRSACQARRNQSRSNALDSLTRAQTKYTAEKQHQATVRRWSKPMAQKVARSARRRIDAIQESDSDVLSNIPAELVPVWNVVKGRIKGSARRTRAEAFTEWAAEHQGEVLAILDRQFQRDVARMVEDEKQLYRDMRKPSTYRRRAAAYESAEVPF